MECTTGTNTFKKIRTNQFKFYLYSAESHQKTFQSHLRNQRGRKESLGRRSKKGATLARKNSPVGRNLEQIQTQDAKLSNPLLFLRAHNEPCGFVLLINPLVLLLIVSFPPSEFNCNIPPASPRQLLMRREPPRPVLMCRDDRNSVPRNLQNVRIYYRCY